MTLDERCIHTNMLPRWRTLHLNYMRQLRMMIRDGRQVDSARDCLKRAQRSAFAARRQWMSAA